jgi:hypothetical protein
VWTYSSSFLPSVAVSGPLPRAFTHRCVTMLVQYDTQSGCSFVETSLVCSVECVYTGVAVRNCCVCSKD